jgi:hypothetical protein
VKFKVRVRGIKELEEFLKKIPRGLTRVALPAFAEWIIGNSRRGLKRYQLYKYVKRSKAYGKVSDAPAGFFSWKQFRYVMAAIHDGRILPGYPRRTGKTQRGYVQRSTNDGYNVFIENKEKGAIYTRHNTLQARLNAMAGWLKESAVVRNNMAGALRHMHAAVRKYLKSR